MANAQPNALSATECRLLMSKGELTSEQLVRACLDRISARDHTVKAWAFIDGEHALEEARRCDSELPRGPLHGIPVGLKDIIETADIPTSYNSVIYSRHQPACDAVCVTALKAAGAIILGKTATSEFAFLSPAPTANPHNLRHTPGGSSSGSAASVSDFMVPLALATQTGGSTIRPASYCGDFALKPSYARIPYTGIKVLASTFDTVGLIARTLEDINLLFSCWSRAASPPSSGPLNIGLCKTPFWSEAHPAAKAALIAACDALKASNHIVSEAILPDEVRVVSDFHRSIMATESVFSFRAEYAQHRERLSNLLRELIEEGLNVPIEKIQQFREAQLKCAIAIDRLFDRHDVLVTLSAPGEAEVGNAIGNNVFNRLWTAMHTPCLTMPFGKGPSGLPLGIQFIGRKGKDEELIQVVSRLQAPLANYWLSDGLLQN